MAVALPPWNENDVVIENGEDEPFALAAKPVVVECAKLVETTGSKETARAAPVEVFVDVLAEPETPGPAWIAAPPLATTEVALAVVEVVAEAAPAPRIIAAAAAAANRCFICEFSVSEDASDRAAPSPPPSDLGL